MFQPEFDDSIKLIAEYTSTAATSKVKLRITTKGYLVNWNNYFDCIYAS